MRQRNEYVKLVKDDPSKSGSFLPNVNPYNSTTKTDRLNGKVTKQASNVEKEL